MFTCLGPAKHGGHGVNKLCRACAPRIRTFCDPAYLKGLVELKREARVFGESKGFPAALMQEVADFVIAEELVERWEQREFVADETVCQICGTLAPHDELHCTGVQAKMYGMKIEVQAVGIALELVVGELKASMSDELRRKLLRMKQ